MNSHCRCGTQLDGYDQCEDCFFDEFIAEELKLMDALEKTDSLPDDWFDIDD